MSKSGPPAPSCVKSAAEAEIGQSLSRKVGRPVSVSCAVPQLLVADPGLAFGCTAEVAGVERQLAVTVVNLAGDLRYRVLPYHAARPRLARARSGGGGGGQPPPGGQRSHPSPL